ncbi:MAG TPA: GTP-binding protein [Polyangia bacterium]|nr:GTP-binding protein [Polyangia bacterium]
MPPIDENSHDGEDRASSPVPLLILTGFLGAGKTTVLNRVLTEQHHRRIGVIINELGRIDIDTRLIKARSGDVMELAGGCVCHEVRVQSELWNGMREVLARSKPEMIVLETTGIAEPWSILDGLAALPPRLAPVIPGGVICVVDAEAGARQLERHEEARAQVEAADRLLISKLDLATNRQAEALHALLAQRNPAAERASFPQSAAGTAELIAWVLEPISKPSPARPKHAAHQHSQLGAAAFAEDGPLLAAPLLALCDRLGESLLRAKGFVHVAGETRRGFLERAGARTSLTFGEPWAAETPRTELVFIGEGLDPAALRRQLWACRASGV